MAGYSDRDVECWNVPARARGIVSSVYEAPTSVASGNGPGRLRLSPDRCASPTPEGKESTPEVQGRRGLCGPRGTRS